MAAITRGTDRKEAIASATDSLTERRVHEVGAAVRFDWTRRLNRGTREKTGSVRRSIEAVTEGLEVSAPGPHLVRCGLQPTRKRDTKRLWTLPPLGTQRTRPQRVCKSRPEREIRTAPTAPLFFPEKNKTTNTYADGCPDLCGFR